MRLVSYELNVELIAVVQGTAYPRASIADVEMISASFCWEFGSRFVGNAVTKDSLWALEIAPFIGERFPVCDIAVRLLKNIVVKVLARQLGTMAYSATEYRQYNKPSHLVSRSPYHFVEIDSKQIDANVKRRIVYQKE